MNLNDLKERFRNWLPLRTLRFDSAYHQLLHELAISREQTKEMQLVELRDRIRMHWRMVDEIRALRPEPAQLACEICGFAGPIGRFASFRSHCMFGGGELVRNQCPECDTIFGPRKMLDLSAAELSAEYETHYRAYSEGDSTENEIRAFHALSPSREGLYLNYGAGGWSRSVSELRAAGWNVLAYEPHQSAAGAQHVITSEDQLTPMSFDGIFSNNVLEHFRHPVQELKKMQTLLKPGAHMAHATPCFQYLYEYTRFHLFFFPGRSLEVLAGAADLRVRSFTVDGHYMSAVLGRGG